MMGIKSNLYFGLFVLIVFSFFNLACSSSSEIKKENNDKEKIFTEEKKDDSGSKPVKIKNEVLSGKKTETNIKNENIDLTEPTVTSPRKILNVEKVFRKKINTNNVAAIERVTYDMIHTGKLVNRKKLSTEFYNDNGFLSEKVMYDDRDSLKCFFKYEYDEKGNRTKANRFDADSNLVKYYIYEYNKHGNKTKVVCYDDNDRKINHYDYKYNDEGKLIEYIWYDWLGRIDYVVKYQYGDNGKKTFELNYLPGNRLISKYKFFYDENDLVIEEMQYSADGMKTGIIQYIYKYDN